MQACPVVVYGACPVVVYAESHDQALVGDQSIIFRLIGSDIYDYMRIDAENTKVDRGMARQKMIRLITLGTAGRGYLNFMGNEFGHPEWIDFPREGNNWSYHYARRQWHLVDDHDLRYRFPAGFDRDMIDQAKSFRQLEKGEPELIYEHSDDKIIIFLRAGLLFVFNFHPERSFTDYRFGAPTGRYSMVLNSDLPEYGGHDRLDPHEEHLTFSEDSGSHERHLLSLYLPTCTALVFQRFH